MTEDADENHIMLTNYGAAPPPLRPLTASEIEQGITLLESAKKHPVMYMGRIDVELTKSWIYGIYSACWIFGAETPDVYRDQVLRKRGWKHTALHCSSQMLEKGMSEEAIVEEILDIQIDVWKRAAQQTRKAEAGK